MAGDVYLSSLSSCLGVHFVVWRQNLKKKYKEINYWRCIRRGALSKQPLFWYSDGKCNS